MSAHPGESALPRYGLAGAFTGERLQEGHGWDICTVVHRPDGSGEEITVGVFRRTTASRGTGLPREAISDGLARESVARVLVEPQLKSREDVYELPARVASQDEAWGSRDIAVDGELVGGYEREFEGMWIAYYLTPRLIVFVLAPVEMRPEVVELRELGADEAPMRQDWPEDD